MKRLATAALLVLLATHVPPFTATRPADAYPGSHVELEGAGWGHGRGMGQYGALGYAVDHGWNWQQILDHFYGGTTAGTVGNDSIRVRLIAFDSRDTIAYSPGGLSVTGTPGAPAAVLVRQQGHSGTYDVFTGPGCGGPWTHAAAVGSNVDIHPKSAGEANFVQACEPDGTRRAYRGFLRTTRDSEGPQRTVNVVVLEQYLRGVVPRESPASWGDAGGGRGMHALRAQAVAARSYAAAEQRYSYGDTCDTTACQVYKGYWDTTFGVREDGRTNQAIADTGGVIRVRGGAVARSEFSSSTGGHTAGGVFPAVVDEGDDTASNPNHRWTARVAVSAIESAYPEIGMLRAVDVTKRNGLSQWGGRAVEVALRGTQGTRTVSGNEFRSRFGLKSDWFRVVNNPSGGVDGYWVLDHVGGVFTFGNARFHGSVPGLRAQGVNVGPADIVALAPTPSGGGYWVLDHVGGIFSFGDARFKGSVPGLRAQGVSIGHARIIGLATTPSGKGYWVLDDAGGMFAFGDAKFHGSVPGLRAQGIAVGPADIVGMTPTRTGRGYWVIDETGGVFAFGDARYKGSVPGLRQAGHQIGRADIVGIAASTNGYWMVDDRGGVFAFGDARFAGSLPGAGIVGEAVGLVPTKTGRGYLIATAADGAVHPFGDAPDFGGIPDTGAGSQGRGLAVKFEP